MHSEHHSYNNTFFINESYAEFTGSDVSLSVPFFPVLKSFAGTQEPPISPFFHSGMNFQAPYCVAAIRSRINKQYLLPLKRWLKITASINAALVNKGSGGSSSCHVRFYLFSLFISCGFAHYTLVRNTLFYDTYYFNE